MARRLLLLVVIGCLLAGLVGSTAAQSPTIVRIGLLTAADSPAGRGTQLAIAEINGAGGVLDPDGTAYAFELLSLPVTNAEETQAGIDALRENGVVAILGPDTTAMTLATFNELRAMNVPVLTPATGDTITIADTGNVIFRSRASEQVYVNGMAAFMANQSAASSVVVVELGEGAATETMADLSNALSDRGANPLSTLQLNDPANLDDLVDDVMGLNPAALVVWGESPLAVDLLVGLRGADWTGSYFFRHATDAEFRDALGETLGAAAGRVWGITNWVPGVYSPVSDAFLQRYVITFGAVPDDLSAAYYDAVHLLAASIQAQGGTAQNMLDGLRGLTGQEGVQGTFAPAQYKTGDSIGAATLVELNIYAVPQVLSLFVDGALVPNEGGLSTLPPVAGDTPTPTATVTPTATPTVTPTATPTGVWGQVDTGRLNVRSGPSTDYEILGQLAADDEVRPIGANADSSWLVISYRGLNGWIAAYLVDVHGPLYTLPIVNPPPTPTVAPTATLTIVPFADLVIDNATVDPVRPISGQPFAVHVTVRNAGTLPTIETAIAATFQPGGVYASATIPALQPGQSMVLTLTPTVSGSGTHTVELVVDLNNLINEGPAGEAVNYYPITYRLDHAALRAGTTMLAPGSQHDIMGSGVMNLTWDGNALLGLNGAQIAVLPGLNWDTLQYEQLNGIAGAMVPRASMPPGIVVGLVTAPEGYRGALRIDGYSGDNVQYTYRIFAQ